MLNRRQLLAATPGLALFAAGCPKGALEGVGNAVKRFLPQVQFDRVNLRDINFDKADLTFLFDVQNPAPLKVALSSFSYALDLEGERFFDGKNPNGVKMPAEGSAKLKFPMTVRWEQLADLLTATKGQDNLGFALAGHMGFNTPAGEAKLPYNAKGDVPALRRPKIQLAQLKVNSLQLAQNRANLALHFDATNLGGEAISFSGFDYNLHLAGQRVASGVAQRLGQIAGNQTERLVLPVDITLTSLGSSIVQTLQRGGNVATGVKASLQVGTPFGDVPLSIDKSKRLQVS